MPIAPSASYSLTLHLRLPRRAGALAEVVDAVERAGGDIAAMRTRSDGGDCATRELTIDACSLQHEQAIVAAIRAREGIEVLAVEDCTFELHRGGKIGVISKSPLRVISIGGPSSKRYVPRYAPSRSGAIANSACRFRTIHCCSAAIVVSNR